MEWIYIVCFVFTAINLMIAVYLIIQIDFVLELLHQISRSLEMDIPQPKGPMDLMLLKAKKTKKANRFTDKSRDWLSAHEKDTRR